MASLCRRSCLLVLLPLFFAGCSNQSTENTTTTQTTTTQTTTTSSTSTTALETTTTTTTTTTTSIDTSTTTTTVTTSTVPWVPDVMVQPLPAHASSTRLSLPTSFDNILIASGEIGAFGAHIGGHMEGLDHIWFYVISGTKVRSWAAGTVTAVTLNGSEYHITINYGNGLQGTHMEVLTPEVAVGDVVAVGQVVGSGQVFASKESAELSLVDANRSDGVIENIAAYVSPFDYLNTTDQLALIASYESLIVTPYFMAGQSIGSDYPWEPYLTNRLLFHKDHRGTVIGEWLLRGTWEAGGWMDILTLMDVSNAYFTGKRIAASDDEGNDQLWGTWEVDNSLNRIVIYDGLATYYGIFELGGTATRETLRLEYQTGTYPTEFSPDAALYIERLPVQRRMDPR